MSKTNKIDVLGIGSPIVDSLAFVDEGFINEIDGEKGGMELVEDAYLRDLLNKLDKTPVKHSGGAAANTIFALSRLDASTAFLGMLGTDEDGEFYRREYASIGGDGSRFKTTSFAPTGQCLSLITPDSERTMRTHLGAAATFAPEVISEEDFVDVRHVHIEGYLLFNRELMLAVLQSAKKAGSTVSFDLGSFEVVNAAKDILPEILSDYIDIVFANEEEAAAYHGNGNYEHALNYIAKSCELAVLKLGGQGSRIKYNGKAKSVEPISIDNPIDTTGAGDYFAAGFLYGYLNELPLQMCGKMGSILGGEVIQHVGTHLPSEIWNEINEKFNSN